MARVLGLLLDESTSRALRRDLERAGDVLEETDPAEAIRLLESKEREIEAVVLGARIDEPVRTAQRVFVVAPELPVLILVEHEQYAAVCQAVQFVPYLSEALRCVDAHELKTVTGALHETLIRLRKSRAHRQTVDALNARLASAPHSLPVAPPALLGGILDNAPIGVVLVDPAGRIQAWNRRAGEILGRRERAVLGLKFEDLLAEKERRRWLNALTRLVEDATSVLHQEAEAFIPGQTRHVEITATQLRVPQKSVLLILQDVTDRLQLVNDLQDAIQARDDFLSIASHELRTPLTSMQLHIQNLNRVADSEYVKARSQAVERGVVRLTTLVENLLDVSRIQQRRFHLQRETVDLRQIVQDVVDRHRIEAERVQSPIAFSGDGPLMGMWDRLRVEQVIANLVINAIKYGAGKPISVDLSGDAHTARLTVSDQGIGIPPEVQNRIFERFERAVSNQNYGGLGLGLWIVRQIVEAHGGRVSLESRPGAGAKFCVELPLHPLQG